MIKEKDKGLFIAEAPVSLFFVSDFFIKQSVSNEKFICRLGMMKLVVLSYYLFYEDLGVDLFEEKIEIREYGPYIPILRELFNRKEFDHDKKMTINDLRLKNSININYFDKKPLIREYLQSIWDFLKNKTNHEIIYITNNYFFKYILK